MLRASSARFVLAASAVIAVCALIVRSRMFAMHPEVAAWGVTFDLTITIPLLYWFFVVRAGKAPALTLAPLFVLCTLLSSFVLPHPRPPFLRDLWRFGVPLAELALVAAIALRLRRARGRNAIRELLGDTRIADVVESELLVLYYALFAWRKKPEEVDGRAITFHQRSGWAAILAAILLLIAAEGIGMHLLLSQWSPAAAWAWTALDVWGALWLLGDWNALRLRRSYLGSGTLHIRMGLRWNVSIPFDAIASVERLQGEWKRRKDVLKVAMLEEPEWLITLREPVAVRGLAGIRKEVRAIALLPDQPEVMEALRDGC